MARVLSTSVDVVCSVDVGTTMEENGGHKGRNKESFDQPATSFSVRRKMGSSTERCFILLAMFLLVTTIVFLGLFVYYYLKYDSAAKTTSSTPDRDTPVISGMICDTPDCVMAAGMMVRKMNLSVDPCQDFYEYACGRFVAESVFSDGKTQVGTFTTISDANQQIMKAIITEDLKPDQQMYLQNMKRYYKSCMDEARQEATGLQSYLNETEFVQDWPTLNPSWDNSTFRLNDVMARYAAVYINGFFTASVGLDFKNSSKKVLVISDISLGLSQEYFARPRNDSVIVAYWTYLKDLAIALQADRSTAEQDAWGAVDFEIALSKIMSPLSEKQDYQKAYNPTTVGNLSAMYPGIDIPRTMRAIFSTANVTLYDDDIVINYYPKYIGNISDVLSNFSSRVIQNYFSFKYAQSRLSGMTKRMREIRQNLDKVYRGKAEESPRWQYCLSETSTIFQNGMAKQFVSKTFPEQAKAYVNEMIDNLKIAFRQILEEITWMGPTTKEAAFRKLDAMRRKIGYPDVDFSEADINKKYEKYTMLETNYYSNRMTCINFIRQGSLLALRTPVDPNEWKRPPYEVNAYYSPSDNDIAFLGGILQPPAFSVSFQDSMNYGAIGMVIGHEITHGFDTQGRQFDDKGNMINWWQKSDMDEFLQRTKCLIDQYSRFHVDEVNLNVNGILTLGENIADNGGLKESFRAYKERVHKKGESPRLPGLGLTQDQLFFLAFGQMWCDKMTNQVLASMINSNEHSPGRYRVIGPLQNFEEFAKTYNCPRGSFMNPETKCSVW